MIRNAAGIFAARSIPLLLVILLRIPGVLQASEYRVTAFSGKVTVLREGEKVRAVSKGDVFGPGDTLKTGRDSTIRLEEGKTRYMVYPYSLVLLGENPEVAWGKLSSAFDDRFLDIRFFLYPRPAQGKTLKIGLRTGREGLLLRSCIRSETGFRKEIVFFPLGGGDYRALTGFDIGLKPDRYLLEIQAEKEGAKETVVYPFYLKETRCESGLVRISGGKSGLFEPSEEKKTQAKKLASLLADRSPDALWEDRFIYPVNEPCVISRFGRRRVYYIGGKRSGARHHRGIDFKGEVGDPVVAPAAGVVRSCTNRVTTGNTLVIDHGQGVFSLFFHLDSISVREGETVRRGEPVARVGETGITEGSHLHWSVVVDEVWVDPIDWIEKKY
ncbi:MAG: M23 family metallopeptidase [Spirochaetes bacterium]|nr:M23 family metallopeptidase [Spirochaetota bacterium]